MKIIKTLAVLLTLSVLLSSFNISFDSGINIELNYAQAASVSSTVVNSPYLTSANARPQVLSNGWIVTAVIDSSRYARIYYSQDKGLTWSLLCYAGNGYDVYNAISLTSYGNKVYLLASINTNTCVCFCIDVTSIQLGSSLNGTERYPEGGQTGMAGCSITADSSGVLHATWSSKNSSYPNSFNIRYSMSINGGYTWTTPTQITDANNSSINYNNPCIAIKNDLKPVIFCEYGDPSWKGINSFNYTTSWNQVWVYQVNNALYPQFVPSATVTGDGAIHVVWYGKDSTDSAINNIRYSKSTDGGITWIVPIKLTSGNTYGTGYPCITSDLFNNLFVYWLASDASAPTKNNIFKCALKNGVWETVTRVTSNTTADNLFPALCDNYKNFSDPLLIYQDNQSGAVKFIGNQNNLPTLQLTPMTTTACSITLPIQGIVKDLDINDKISIKYQIDNSEEQIALSNITSGGIDVPITINSIDIRALSSGNHKLTIWAVDSNGALSQKQSITFNKTDTVKLSYANISPTSIELNISDIDPSNTQYQITCNNSYLTEEGNLTKTPLWIRRQNNLSTSSSITVTGLEAKTKYTFQIKAIRLYEQEGITYNSVSCITGYNSLSAPTALSSNLVSDKITLTWKPVEGATEYEIDADGIITTTSALSFNHNRLQPNTKHIYRVRAKNQESRSEWSTLIKVSTKNALPTVPQNITSSSIGTAINISWNSVSQSAIGYEIEADGNIIQNGIKTAYKHTGLKPNTQHTYRVRTIGVDGPSSWSTLKTIFTTDGLMTTTPQNILSKATNNTITLNWDAVSDAEAYDIMPILVDGTTGAAIDNGILTTCDIRGLLPNTTYKYRIRAKNSAGEGPWSNEIQVNTYLLDTPQNVTSIKNDTSINFSWNAVLGADGYELKYYSLVSGSTGSCIIVEASTCSSITLTELTPCTEYKYSIRSKNSQGYSSWREEKSTFTLPQKPGTPDNVNATVSDSKITINWIGLMDPTVVGYDVELDGVVLEDGTETTYIHEGLETYSMHTYRVRARNDLVEGDWSPMDIIRTLPTKPIAPKAITVKSTQTGATLSWKAELGATGYDLYVYKLDNNDNEVMVEEINNIEDCTYTHRRQTKGEEYRYRIRTRNIQGISAWSGDIINNAIKAECKKNNTIDLGLTATDVVDFSGYEMVVTYNPGVVEIADLSTLTGKPELTSGKIEGTGITIKEFSQGRIVFVVDKAVTPGEAWTGVINGIKFKARETGGTTITYTVFTKLSNKE